MAKKPVLVVMAAGMGSRYGGLKQLDKLGPNGETIMDYSIYDAINAGFGKLVFVIRKDFEQDFRDIVLKKYESKIPCELVFQALDALPEGFTCPADRQKPWGTGHAILCAREFIDSPFAVINADDFYGKSGFTYASHFGIRYHGLPEGEDASFFLCKELIPGYLDGITGEYATPSGYFVDEGKAEEFDKRFPHKEKLKLPGQLW